MSALNCKPGDLAVVVRSYLGQDGKLLRVVRESHWRGVTLPDGTFLPCHVWETNSVGKWGHPMWADHQLKPLRDPGADARDETLTWLPVPSTTKEAA